MKTEIIEKITEKGVTNLQEFGYKFADNENIFTDYIYSAMFMSMLEDNLGLGFDDEVNYLMGKINKNPDLC